jgi:hypothetical protein
VLLISSAVDVTDSTSVRDTTDPATVTREQAIAIAQEELGNTSSEVRVLQGLAPQFEGEMNRDVWVILFKGGVSPFDGPVSDDPSPVVYAVTGVLIDAQTGEASGRPDHLTLVPDYHARRRWDPASLTVDRRSLVAATSVLVRGTLIAACVAPPEADTGAVPANEMTLGVSNGTSLEVTLLVNGKQLQVLAPGEWKDAIPAQELPPLPWSIEAQSPSGRVLLTLTVFEGDVVSGVNPGGSTFSKGDAARVDLSCGRIDIWSGPPLAGPAPGPGSPGDCD